MNLTIVRKPALTIEEETLRDGIYKNCYVLGFFHKQSREFKAVFENDMFIRPNTKAFPHVIHFLLTALDPNEFKKRFYWPIVDKGSETIFRSSIISYLNHLNIKHNMGLEPIKSHIVVLPGGIKFMKVIFELSTLVMSEELRKRSNSSENTVFSLYNFESDRPLTSRKLHSIKNEIKEEVDKVINLKTKLEETTEIITKQTESLKKTFTYIFNDIKYLDSSFIDPFRDHVNKIINSDLEPRIQKIFQFRNECCKLSTSITDWHNGKFKSTIDYDKDVLKNALTNLCRVYPNNKNDINNVIVHQQKEFISFNNLLATIECILPVIIARINNYVPINEKKLELEIYKLNVIGQRTTQIEKNIDILGMRLLIINGNSGIETNNIDCVIESNLAGDILCSPALPIDRDAIQMMSRKRIALHSDISRGLKLNNPQRNINFPNGLLQSHGKLKPTMHVKSNLLSSLSNKSSSSALSMLKSLQKKPKTSSNLDRSIQISNRAIKFTENDSLYSDLDTTIDTGKSFDTIIPRSVSNIQHHSILRTKTTLSPDTIIYEQLLRTNSIIHLDTPKSHNSTPQYAVNKSLYITKSPTGRIESLIQHTSSKKYEHMKQNPSGECQDTIPKTKNAHSIKNMVVNESTWINGVDSEFLNIAEETLCDTSDTVIRDISF